MSTQTEKAAELGDRLRSLDVERRAMESEIVALCDILDQPGMPGIKGKLIDAEGFPIEGIDHHQVMSMRGRIACLNTDLSATMKQIEVGLADLHALQRVDQEPTAKPLVKADQEMADEETKAAPGLQAHSKVATVKADPCLWITDVREGSPAADAGLLLGDAVRSFGSFEPSKDLTLEQTLAEVKKVCLETLQSEKVTIFVTVERRSLFGDTSEVIIMLYSRACVNEAT